MAETATRLLELLSLLQSPRSRPGSDLSGRLGVSRRTVRRDVDRLRRLGYQVHAEPGPAGGYRLVAGSTLPPLLLNEEEAVAIGVGLRLIAAQPIERLEDASVRALAQVGQILPGRLARTIRGIGAATASRAEGGPLIDPDAIVAFSVGIEAREQMRFAYRDGKGAVSRRLVKPHHLVFLRARWYLVAFDLRREDWRTFRLDRVERPERIATRFEPRRLSPEDPVAFVTDKLYELAPTYRGVITLHASAEEIAPRLGSLARAVTPLSPRRSSLEMETETIEWLAALLLRLGCTFDVYEPVELTEHLREIRDRIDRSVPGTGGAVTFSPPSSSSR